MYKPIKFEKYHGLGNDFIIINKDDLEKNGIKSDEYSIIVKKISDRHTGIGSDGCIILDKISDDKCEMIFFNQDGTRASMCGNGIRCFTHYIFEHGILKGEKYKILTGSGELEVNIDITSKGIFKCKVNMGKPIYNIDNIPLDKDEFERIKKISNSENSDKLIYQRNYSLVIKEEKSQDYILELNDILEPSKIKLNKTGLKLDSLFMGTIHSVAFVDNLEEFPVEELGQKIEINRLFPKKTNVNFVEIIDRENIKMKTWERGVGLTFACGTGASASVVVGALKYALLEQKVMVHLPKGILEIEITEDEDVFMTGPSKKIGKGEYIYERN